MPPRLMVGEEEVDIQTLGSFYRSMPARLVENNLQINALRTNTLLHKDEWELLDSPCRADFRQCTQRRR